MRRAILISAGVTVLAWCATLVAAPPERGRDPWVFRCIFEDRTRMVIIAAGDDRWFAFNPATGSVQKSWRGDIDLRGKVWDFSQSSSRARGEVLYEDRSEIWSLPDSPPLPGGWIADGVTYDDGWRFEGDGASLTSPAFDLTGWQRVFIAFDEISRKGPIRVELSTDGGRTWDGQHFESTKHGSRDDRWQWNFKQIFDTPATARVRFVQTEGRHAKRLRRIRMFGDRPTWHFGDGARRVPAKVVWRGYRLVNRTEAVHLEYDLVTPDGHVVHVRHEPKPEGRRWTETLKLANVPADPPLWYRAGAEWVEFPNDVETRLVRE